MGSMPRLRRSSSRSAARPSRPTRRRRASASSSSPSGTMSSCRCRSTRCGARAPDRAGAPAQLAPARALALLGPLLVDAAVLKVGHDVRISSRLLALHGQQVVSYDDVMLLSYALEGGQHGHGLDELAL